MNQRTRSYIYCGVAAIALLLPCGAHAAAWLFTSVRSSFSGLPGATGNGITDDTAAINRAIAAGTTIYFPPGVYRYAVQSTFRQTNPTGFMAMDRVSQSFASLAPAQGSAL